MTAETPSALRKPVVGIRPLTVLPEMPPCPISMLKVLEREWEPGVEVVVAVVTVPLGLGAGDAGTGSPVVVTVDPEILCEGEVRPIALVPDKTPFRSEGRGNGAIGVGCGGRRNWKPCCGDGGSRNTLRGGGKADSSGAGQNAIPKGDILGIQR